MRTSAMGTRPIAYPERQRFVPSIDSWVKCPWPYTREIPHFPNRIKTAVQGIIKKSVRERQYFKNLPYFSWSLFSRALDKGGRSADERAIPKRARGTCWILMAYQRKAGPSPSASLAKRGSRALLIWTAATPRMPRARGFVNVLISGLRRLGQGIPHSLRMESVCRRVVIHCAILAATIVKASQCIGSSGLAYQVDSAPKIQTALNRTGATLGRKYLFSHCSRPQFSPQRQINTKLGIIVMVRVAISLFSAEREGTRAFKMLMLAPTTAIRTRKRIRYRLVKKWAARSGDCRLIFSNFGTNAVCRAPSPKSLRRRCASLNATKKAATVSFVPKAKAMAMSRMAPEILLSMVPLKNWPADLRMLFVLSMGNSIVDL